MLDRAFLAGQCFGDPALERELLLLYVASAERLVAAMPAMTPRARAEAAHRLRGSSQGIGAWAMARAAQDAEIAVDDAWATALVAAFADVARVIRAHLADG